MGSAGKRGRVVCLGSMMGRKDGVASGVEGGITRLWTEGGHWEEDTG